MNTSPRRGLLAAAASSLALATAVMLAPAALALPQDPKAHTLASTCGDSTSVTLTLHPGIGKALWDVTSVDVTNSPSFLIKGIDQEVFVNGESIGMFAYRFGNKIGLGDPITCTYTETFTGANGELIEVHGTSYRVLK
jgi:hypothetical protein